jgi:ribosomal protein S18 acetylase RimI-like enzyme
MNYVLVPASEEDKEWLDRLRRDVYQDLFQTTFGGWDEARHARHFMECWERGGIFIDKVDGRSVGMIPLIHYSGTVEIAEIQIDITHQNKRIGTRLARAHSDRKAITLRVGLKNMRARRLYLRLGFVMTVQDDTHII